MEERPFAVIRKRVTNLETLIMPKDRTPESNTPENVTPIDFAKMREEIELEFEQFNSQTIRLQLTMDTNARDVQRYEAERVKISESHIIKWTTPDRVFNST